MSAMPSTIPVACESVQPRRLPSETTMFRALLERDSSFDGVFFVAVKTTSIFCRPTCPAKKPQARNVEFFAAAADALAAGYRPCKRCRPMDNGGCAPAWVERLLRAVDARPSDRFTDDDLRSLSIEPTRARAYFKRHYGMTFHAYHRARRLGTALADLRRGEDPLRAGHRNGFRSASGFRDAFVRLFGAPPSKGDSIATLAARWLDTPLGPMLAVAHDDGLCMLEFVDRRGIEKQIEKLRRRFDDAVIVPKPHAHLDRAQRELREYFDGSRTRFTVSIAMRGSEFQRGVWDELLAIPAGKTTSYARIANNVGEPGAARAVGRANGENPIAIIVPCHRVVRSDGSLCGYGGHRWRKQWLLDHEACKIATHHAPC